MTDFCTRADLEAAATLERFLLALVHEIDQLHHQAQQLAELRGVLFGIAQYLHCSRTQANALEDHIFEPSPINGLPGPEQIEAVECLYLLGFQLIGSKVLEVDGAEEIEAASFMRVFHDALASAALRSVGGP